MKNKHFYPASQTLIKKLGDKELYNNFLEIRKPFKIDNTKIYDERLRDYQNEDVDFMIKRKNKANFNQQRLGKTPTTLISLKHTGFKKLLIIAPKSTLINWEQEVYKWIGKPAYRLRGSKAQRLRAYGEHNIFLCSYQMVARDYLDMPDFDTIVVDEAHRLRNFRSTRKNVRGPAFAKAIMNLSYKADKKIALTGTPAPNYSYNIFPILHFLYPNLFSSFWNFVFYYYETEKVPFNRQGDSAIHILDFKEGKEQELQEFLDFISIQRKRIDHMKWVPEVDRQTVELPMSRKQNRLYMELLETYEIKDSDIICQGHLDLMIRLRQVAISPRVLGFDITSSKEEFILDYVKDYPEEQIFIVSEFTSYLKILHEKIPNSRLLIGESSNDDRKQVQDDFNKRKFHVLLGNIQVAKEGLKLEEGNVIIFLDPSLTYADNEQVEDRIIPTSKEVALEKDVQKVIYLVTKDSIDGHVRARLDEKKSSSDIINDFQKYLAERRK